MSDFSSLRIAVIGSSGHAARVSAPTIAAVSEAKLVAVLGSSPDRATRIAQQHDGCRVLHGLDELCEAPDIDAVWVAGPNHLHLEHAAACLTAGKHVLLEKPIATTVADAEQLAAIAEQGNATLTVGFQHRFWPAHTWLYEQIQSRTFGEVAALRIHRFWPFPYYPDMPSDPTISWRSSAELSGGWVLNDIGAHLIDLARWLLGGPMELAFARTNNVKFVDAEVEDTALLVLEAAGGATVTIETSNAMPSFPGTIEVHGTDGWARTDGTFDTGGEIVTSRGEHKVFEHRPVAEIYRRELVDFVNGLRGVPSMGATAREAAETVAIVAAAVRARGAAQTQR